MSKYICHYTAIAAYRFKSVTMSSTFSSELGSKKKVRGKTLRFASSQV